jgi:hypothetical protein
MDVRSHLQSQLAKGHYLTIATAIGQGFWEDVIGDAEYYNEGDE